MKIDDRRFKFFIFILVVLFSVFAVIKTSEYQKQNPKNNTVSKKPISTTGNAIENVKLSTTSSTTKAINTTSSTTSSTSAVKNSNLSKSYRGDNFSILYPSDWAETSSQPKYLLISSTKDPTNLTVKFDEEINNFPGYQKKSEEDVLFLAQTFKLELWEPLALDDDFGSGSVNNLAIINLKKDEKKSLLIYSYQSGQSDSEKIKEFKTIIDSFNFK